MEPKEKPAEPAEPAAPPPAPAPAPQPAPAAPKPGPAAATLRDLADLETAVRGEVAALRHDLDLAEEDEDERAPAWTWPALLIVAAGLALFVWLKRRAP